MNPIKTGKAIASLRKKAGYTQATLAEALEVSDKAVSKWERGIACPDLSLFPKLSILLDTDIDDLINGEIVARNHNWKGIVFLDDLAAVSVYTKPMVYYLIQNFLLVGIRDILVVGGDVSKILGTGEQWGIQLTYEPCSAPADLLKHSAYISSSTMIIYGNTLIYGADLTRKFQYMMLYTKTAIDLVTDGKKQVPILFCHESVWKSFKGRLASWNRVEEMISCLNPVHKSFTRGGCFASNE